MLDTDTKRRIDSCRDILVGKVPDPKSQVEQITIALIYKFMDDMDAEAEELGGKRSFFAGDYDKYGWAKLMRSGLGGHETLNLYAEAIAKMPENPGIPALFRDIFKNAYLPYRDPETLRSFLKEIDGFTYDHSERLGDAFEYLLSVLGSQGDAGQFRTPRHIIDFMVEIVDPKKNESILDPACGTAGFLISSYKHILKHNTKGYREQQGREAYDEKGVPIESLILDSPLHYKGDLLTPDDRKRLAANIHGYDISPDMVRLSLVNLYLHGFTDPHIVEYDTLTSEERWNETADVILANPPFMSPKGGIKPHKRFSVQATRSEVLFVDYMAEHLSPQGRAAIIVPEGIIFQSGSAYKQLREMLVKTSLVAVISLPAGVFNPYSGVKTSILILDKRLAKKIDDVLFVKIENDGFNLGAQRRAVTGSSLPEAVRQLREFFTNVGALENSVMAHRVARAKIGENGEWNLSGERYLFVENLNFSHHPEERLGNLVDILSGFPFKSELFNEDAGFPVIRIRNIKPSFTTTKYSGEHPTEFVVENGDLLIGMDGEFNATLWRGGPALLNQRVCKLRNFRNCLREYVYYMIPRLLKQIEDSTYAVTVKHLSVKQIKEMKIPLPPLAIQQEIVAEIDSYQKIIDGARAVLDNYRPRIPIHPGWTEMPLGEVCRLGRGFAFKSEDYVSDGILSFRVSNIGKDRLPNLENSVYLPKDFFEKYAEYQLQEGDFVIVMVGATTGKIGYITADILPALLNQNMWRFHPDESVLDKRFLYYAIDQLPLFRQGGARDYLKQSDFLQNLVPIPPLETQQAIVAEIETEQALVNANKQLIARFEAKIKTTINRVWGESNPEPLGETA